MLYDLSRSSPGGHAAQALQDFMQLPWPLCDPTCIHITHLLTRKACLGKCRSECQRPAPVAEEHVAGERAMHTNKVPTYKQNCHFRHCSPRLERC